MRRLLRRPPRSRAPGVRLWVWVCLGLGVVLAPAGRTTRADVQLVPAHIDVGEWAAGGSTTGVAWLINTGSSAVRVTRAHPGDGAVRLVDFRPRELPPSGAMELRLAVDAPAREGVRATRAVTVDLAGGPSVTLKADITAIHPDVHLARPDHHDWSPLRAAPPQIDFGPAAPGERVERSVWLINASRSPLRVTAAKANCGCLEAPGFGGLELAPGRAAEVRLTMLGQGETGQERFKYISFLTEGHQPLSVEARMDVIDPRIAKVRRYLDAIARDDATTARTCLALDARIWLNDRTGAGVRRDAEGRAPWVGWDRALHTSWRVEDARLEDDTAVMTLVKHNDLHRLLETPPARTQATFWFNADREIEGILYRPAPPTDAWRGQLDELGAWAERHRPDEWKALRTRPETAAYAHRWRALAIEWRKATGRRPLPIH